MDPKLLVLIFILIPVILFVIIGMWMMGIYNSLVRLRNRFENAFAQIDVMLQRRYDLIPNLVSTAKGYMQHEKETLTAVIEARNQAFQAAKAAAGAPGDMAAVGSLMQAESSLTASLGRLLAISESYPDLKADQQMTALMEELTSTENKIGFARQAYNDAVMRYNEAREVFPSSLVASFFKFEEKKMFEIEDPKVRQAPVVEF